MTQSCTTSSDCDRGGVVKFCYPKPAFSNQTFICDCSAWYGWTGDLCNQQSSQTVFLRFTLVFFGLWSLLVLLLSTRTMVMLITGLKKKRNTKKLKPLAYTLVLSSLAAFCIFLFMVLTFPGTVNPDYFEVEEYNSIFVESDEDVSVLNGQLVGSTILFSAAFHILASIVVVTSWMNLLLALDRFFPPLLKISEATIKRTLQIIILSTLVVLTLLASLQLLFEGTIFLIFLAIVLSAVYLIGYFRIIIRLKPYNGGARAKKIADAIALIKRSARVNVICNLGFLISILIFYLLTLTYDEVLTPGQFNYINFMRDFSFFFVLYMISFTLYYVHRVVSRFLKMGNIYWIPGLDKCIEGAAYLKDTTYITNTADRLPEDDNITQSQYDLLQPTPEPNTTTDFGSTILQPTPSRKIGTNITDTVDTISEPEDT